MKIYDISWTLKNGTPVYPGNAKFKINTVSKVSSASSNISELSMGTHTGTHMDSKRHISNNGWGVDAIPLKKVIGRCAVLDLSRKKFGEGITEDDLRRYHFRKDDIVILKTKNSALKTFRKDYVYLTEDGANYLASRKIKSVGIDYLSIQKFHTGRCAAHCAFLKSKIPIFEGLRLSKVKSGRYTFIGLPLKIKDADGAPARVILLEN